MYLPGLTELIYDRFTQRLCHWCSTSIFLIEGTSVDNLWNCERAENIPKPDIVSIESTNLLNKEDPDWCTLKHSETGAGFYSYSIMVQIPTALDLTELESYC